VDQDRRHWRCSTCGSRKVTPKGRKVRQFRSLPIGERGVPGSSGDLGRLAPTKCLRRLRSSASRRTFFLLAHGFPLGLLLLGMFKLTHFPDPMMAADNVWTGRVIMSMLVAGFPAGFRQEKSDIHPGLAPEDTP